VDDGSTDGTADAVRSARADGMPEIRLIRRASPRIASHEDA
jgi:glycosyltransferase involved in cell wall biosynthesis